MWSFFSRDPTKDFPYEILEKVTGLEDRSLWSLHNGKKKSTGEQVSVFVFDVKAGSESQLQVAKNSFKRIKTLRHPNILTFLDGLESDKFLYIATEHVVPLETYLKNERQRGTQNDLAISWGLHQIVKGLSFLINDCKLIHNNMCLSSVFVDVSGEWKIGGVDYMYPAEGPDCIPPVKILPLLEKYEPPERAMVGHGRKGTERWSTDSWGLGCLTWEVFNGELPRASSLKSIGKIPKTLTPHYCELVGANPKVRPNPAKFLENCRSPGGFLGNNFVKTMLFLEEFQIKEQNEKTKFFNLLTPELDSFPQSHCKHKILPLLINAFEFGNAGSAVLAPLFKLGRLLDTDEYQKKIVPCVIKLFSSSDRSTRVKLLQQLEHFIEHLQESTVNSQIFPQVLQGFMDTNPVVREQTIKAMLHMAPKLNYKNLNEELMKHFARLQSKDDQGGIRTNTTVCLGKIGGYLDPQIRQRVLPSAFMRGVKDPFPPARQAAVLAMTACNNYFTLKESASRLLPTLCSMTLDPEKTVRDQAFKAIKCFLTKLEKASDDPESITELEKDVKMGGSAASSAASWAGWAVTGMSSITSKFVKTKPPDGKPPSKEPAGQVKSLAASTPTPERTPQEDRVKDTPTEEEEPSDACWGDDDDWGDIEDTSAPDQSQQEEEHGNGDDGWDDDDDWGSLEEPTQKMGAAYNKQASSNSQVMKVGASKPQSDTSSAWDSFGNDDFTSVEDPGLEKTSSYNWGDSSDDFFSTLSDTKPKVSKAKSPSPKPQPVAKTKSPSPKPQSQPKPRAPVSQKQNSGWDDGWSQDDGWAETTADSGWGNADDGWGSFDNIGSSNTTDLARQRREEKKMQRQKEIEQKRAAKQSSGFGGAMKLGAKKKNID